MFVINLHKAPVAQWIERLFPKQKAVGSTPTWRVSLQFKDPMVEILMQLVCIFFPRVIKF